MEKNQRNIGLRLNGQNIKKQNVCLFSVDKWTEIKLVKNYFILLESLR